MKNQKGFTLIEMLVVLLIISVLILVSVPNISKHFTNVDEKGCEAYVKMVEGQIQAYRMEYKYTPMETDLLEKEYIRDKLSCPNGDRVEIDYMGRVKVVSIAPTPTEQSEADE